MCLLREICCEGRIHTPVCADDATDTSPMSHKPHPLQQRAADNLARNRENFRKCFRAQKWFCLQSQHCIFTKCSHIFGNVIVFFTICSDNFHNFCTFFDIFAPFFSHMFLHVWFYTFFFLNFQRGAAKGLS